MAEPQRLHMIAGLEDLAQIRRFVESAATQGGSDTAKVADMLLALNEAATNIIEHGYHGAPGSLEVEVEYDGDALTVRLRDQAPVFDPALVAVPDVTLPLDRRPLGGMGVHLMRRLTDVLSYRTRSDGWNELVLVKKGVRKP
jgi:serine/threonine-protein kinase RsbW